MIRHFDKYMISALSMGLILLSLFIEYITPVGLYIGSGYVIAVMLTLFSGGQRDSVFIAILSCLAVLFTVFFINTRDDFYIATMNHTVSLVAVVITMFFVLHVKQLQTKFEEENKQVGSLFSHATEGIILTNRSGEIVLVNPFAEKLFGYTKEELVGQKIEILIPKEVRGHHTAHRDQFHAKPVNRRMGEGRDLFATRKDGSVFPVEISLSQYNSGRDSFVIAFIIDITIRKNNEVQLQHQREELERISKEIKALNIDLERKVNDRTMMLRETLAQLEQSKDELAISLEKEKELSDLKTRFVSTVSHEFRTPLSTILSSAALIGKYPDAAGQENRERHIGRIKESVKLMSDMLEDLLSLGRLEEGLIQAKTETIRLDEFLQSFVNEMQEIARKGQHLNLIFSGEPLFTADKSLLKKILLNLVSNAIKFSSEDATIEITGKRENNQLYISVKDSGIGISNEDQEHLFERFFRARNAANIQGTGLGLHIVSKYLELIDGSISLQSELGKGCTFTILVPNK